MNIRLSDLEPILAQRIRDEEQQITEAIRAERQLPGWTPFHEAIKSRETAKLGLRSLTGIGGFFLGAFFLILLVVSRRILGFHTGPESIFIIFGLVMTIATVANRHFYSRITRNAESNYTPLGLAVVARSKEEKLYGDLVDELAKAGGATEGAARSLLREMNALMGSYRVLEQRHEDSKKAMGNRSVEGLEAELRGLKKRAEAATDPLTHEALEQSVHLCASRIESVKALTLAQERAKAQQEVVLQTLGSVHAAFAHMRNAPNDFHYEAEQLMEKVNDLQNRTRAVEQAVEELVTARTR